MATGLPSTVVVPAGATFKSLTVVLGSVPAGARQIEATLGSTTILANFSVF